MSKPIASLSLDLDNKWSYLKTHGDPGWESFPSYLNLVVPRFLEFLGERDLTITVFVVGQDAALAQNHAALGAIAEAGHEIGNHSFHHEPWLHLYSDARLETEIASAADQIELATGERPVGFRGPGFSLSEGVLRVLARQGYEYDASTFPTFLGPLARAYFFCTSRLNRNEKEARKILFGKFREGFKPLRPYYWNVDGGKLLEVPVTTMPLFKVPIHVSYLLYLAQYSKPLALAYFRSALALCQLNRVNPSLLLHPLDFLGREDESDLSFFPAMQTPRQAKLDLVSEVLAIYSRQYRVLTMREHAHFAAEPRLATGVLEPAYAGGDEWNRGDVWS